MLLLVGIGENTSNSGMKLYLKLTILRLLGAGCRGSRQRPPEIEGRICTLKTYYHPETCGGLVQDTELIFLLSLGWEKKMATTF